MRRGRARARLARACPTGPGAVRRPRGRARRPRRTTSAPNARSLPSAAARRGFGARPSAARLEARRPPALCAQPPRRPAAASTRSRRPPPPAPQLVSRRRPATRERQWLSGIVPGCGRAASACPRPSAAHARAPEALAPEAPAPQGRRRWIGCQRGTRGRLEHSPSSHEAERVSYRRPAVIIPISLTLAALSIGLLILRAPASQNVRQERQRTCNFSLPLELET